jgi:hypothetical protein
MLVSHVALVDVASGLWGWRNGAEKAQTEEIVAKLRQKDAVARKVIGSTLQIGSTPWTSR